MLKLRWKGALRNAPFSNAFYDILRGREKKVMSYKL